MTGTIVKALSGFYYTYCDGTVYECKARGSFRKSGVSPLVGDRVEFTLLPDGKGVIENIGTRKSFISRPPVANIDKLFIVSAFKNPPPSALVIDKMTVIAEYSGIEPVIVFNKCDEGDFTEWERLYKNAGFKTFVISAKSGEGTDAVAEEMKNCVSAFTGNSGVGKSSIINRIFGEDVIETGEISQKLGRGRHTTRHCELYRLPEGGFIADTPGFSSLELNNTDYGLKLKLADCFRDFSDYKNECRFTGCSHTSEKGCGVLSAVADGKIATERHESYLALYNELKDLKSWTNKK